MIWSMKNLQLLIIGSHYINDNVYFIEYLKNPFSYIMITKLYIIIWGKVL